MADPKNAATYVDDFILFLKCAHLSYGILKGLHDDFLNFKKRTFSSFYVFTIVYMAQ